MHARQSPFIWRNQFIHQPGFVIGNSRCDCQQDDHFGAEQFFFMVAYFISGI